ncbi:MAG: hypothetical protein Q4F57_04760 [Weeksellaceae bacterium]|nr:hypothetical protein [Weeksellaceae bacterium]
MLFAAQLDAQAYRNFGANPILERLTVTLDQQVVNTDYHTVYWLEREYLAMPFEQSSTYAELELVLSQEVQEMALLPSRDFVVTDSLMMDGSSRVFRWQLRFEDLSRVEFLRLQFAYVDMNYQSKVLEIPVLPYTHTRAEFYPGNTDIYLGETQRYEITTDRLENLHLDGFWKDAEGYRYRLVREQNQAVLYLEPKRLGEVRIEVPMSVRRPYLTAEGRLQYEMPPLTGTFQVRQSRLQFLRLDGAEYVLDRNQRDIEIQLENHPRLQMEKTYRIEDTDEKNGTLIAELFTERRLGNDKILTRLRLYNTHNPSQGYLYIKDGDTPMFLTNANIIPRTQITKVEVLRSGNQWTTDTTVRPGETIDLRVEGTSLSRAKIAVEDTQLVVSDSLTRNDNSATLRVKIPMNVAKSSLGIFVGNQRSGRSLNVVEYQRPRELDFVTVNYGDGPRVVSAINEPVLYGGTIREVALEFDRNRIDGEDVVYGKQYLQIDVRMEDKNGRLLETKDLGTFVICPGTASPRFTYYAEQDCRVNPVLLNNYLAQKTHAIGEWGKVIVTISHDRDRYGTEGYTQTITLYNQRLTTFDIELSLPAGLITQKIGAEENISGLGGISIAMLAQFSFYRKGEIQRMSPWKIGAGFLAQNTFNFREDAVRDLGIVVIGSVYPIRMTGRLRFPLHAGGGYYLQQGKFFILMGPGIQINF